MNVAEGARRMRRAGQWLVIVPLAVLALLICVAAVWALIRPDLRSPFGLVPIFIPLVIPGGVLWLAGWIVEGFAKDAD
jgi:hypothetical protein